jgi:ribonuclease Z
MHFEFTVLGANSATPMPGRFPSSFVLTYDHISVLLDCGEGAQIKLQEFGIKPSRIKLILISHLHGDHIFGLPGLIHSLHLNERTESLQVIGPFGIKRFIQDIMDVTGAVLHYPLEIRELTSDEYHFIMRLSHLDIYALPLKHRIPTYGYIFQENRSDLNIDKNAIERYSLTIEEIKKVKQGDSVERNGKVIPNHLMTLSPPPMRKMAYCTDTVFDPGIVQFIEGSDLLYHEATYLDEMAKKARERTHSTCREAAQIAVFARVKKLVIGHYSSRYRELKPLLDEARSVFPATELAMEGVTFSIEKTS